MESESLEASAQDKTEREHVDGGTWDNVGSSGSAGASAAGSEEARNNQDMLLDNLANEHLQAYVEGPVVVDFAQLSAKSPVHLLSALRHCRMPSLISLASTGQWRYLLACLHCHPFVRVVLLLHMAPHVMVRILAYSGFSCQESPANPPPLTRRASGVGHPTST